MKLTALVLAGLISIGLVGFGVFSTFYRIVVKTDYHPHQSRVGLELNDDQASELIANFDPSHVDRRLLDQWQVNSSGATIRLDCPDMKVDRNPEFDRLYASYSDAIDSVPKYGFDFLPSANMVDGAAKQFDDGLYAAIDVALYTGKLTDRISPPQWIKSVAGKLDAESEAKAFLAAALELAGQEIDIDASLKSAKASFLDDFNQNEVLNKPISFYTWNDDLKWIWKFSKFLQHEFAETAIPDEISKVLKADESLLAAYQSLVRHADQMSNPAICLSLDQLKDGKPLAELASQHNVANATVAIFPASSSKETDLFNRLFGNGVPENVNLMSALIERILSGEVDLSPRDNSGWYDHQIHALETLLITTAGKENDKLLMTAKYKKRLLEAFKSMITKRRETHARQMALTKEAKAAPPTKIEPRLRVEPCATFYLRTARAYRFVANFLESTIGKEDLGKLTGLRKIGDRGKPLAEELIEMQNRFYGLYLVVCDDIGMAAEFATDESVDQEACFFQAVQWLDQIQNDIDLQKDTRVSVPVSFNLLQNRSRLWATLGVRLVPLDVSYVTPPRIRAEGESEWQEVKLHTVKGKRYVITVDEWAELDCKGLRAFNRTEFRAFCDKHKTRDAIIAAVN